MAQLQAPALGQGERIEQGIEQRNVAEAKTQAFEPRLAHRPGGKTHDLGVGAGAIRHAKALDTGLTELAGVRGARSPRLKPEGRAVIAIARVDIGTRMALEIKPRHRHGEIGAQAKLLTGEIGEDIGAAAQTLADLIEQDVGRLDQRGRNPLVARRSEHVEQALGLGFEGLELLRRFRGHGSLAFALDYTSPRRGEVAAKLASLRVREIRAQVSGVFAPSPFPPRDLRDA